MYQGKFSHGFFDIGAIVKKEGVRLWGTDNDG